MTIGERGGTTRSLEAGRALIEQEKAALVRSIRADILTHLDQYGEWHRDNLTVKIPAESKNAVGAVVSGLISAGTIEEAGERRRSSDPAAHGRKSNVFRLRRSAQAKGTEEPATVEECCRGGSVEDIDSGQVETIMSSITVDTGGSGSTADLPEPARLFEVHENRWEDAA